MNYGCFTQPNLGMFFLSSVLLQCTKRVLASCCMHFGEGAKRFAGDKESMNSKPQEKMHSFTSIHGHH